MEAGEGPHPRMGPPRLQEIPSRGEQPPRPFPALPLVPSPGSSTDRGTHLVLKAVPLIHHQPLSLFSSPSQWLLSPLEHRMKSWKAKKHQGLATLAFPTSSFPPVSIPHPDMGLFPRGWLPAPALGALWGQAGLGLGWPSLFPHISHPGAGTEAPAQLCPVPPWCL